MKHYIFFVVLLVHTVTNANLVWGKKGHRVTGHIAEQHLTKKARKKINKLLDGHSLAFVSTYADEIKSDRSFSEYSPWHYVNYPLGTLYKDSEKSEHGDIVAAIATCQAVIKDANSSKDDKIFHLKLLVHLIGDLHQPLHVGRGEDKGGNDIQVRWFNDGSNLHKVWDTNMIESYGMSYEELGDELLQSTTKQEKQKIQAGLVIDWVEESHVLATKLYGSAKVGEKLSYRYSYENNPLLFDQLKKGGLRLAKVLNELFE